MNNKNSVITISRQYGSRGHEIGMLLAKKLDVPFYDKEKLKLAAKEGKWTDEMMTAYGEKHAGSLLHSLAMGAYSFGYFEPAQQSPISQKAYLVAFDIVRRVAKQGPCVIVGRCADYALQNSADVTSVFIHAPLAWRTENIMARLGVSERAAAEKIAETDRLRRSYYNYYTNKNWGDVDSYALTLDSSPYTPDDAAQLLLEHVTFAAELKARAHEDTHPGLQAI